MSISLPNGTLLSTPSTQTQYTAAVTRILHLSNFPSALKTRDLHVMFKDFEAEKGGFRIKWVDDTNALVVFGEASVAKRAYLAFLLRPPPNFPSPAQIKPYDKPDAGQIISSLSARAMGHRASMSSAQVSGSGQVNGESLLSHSQGRASSISGGQSGAIPVNAPGGAGGSGGMGSFSFPKQRTSISTSSSSQQPSGITSAVSTNGARPHQRTGSASSFSRSSGVGALNFGGLGRLPTHNESLDSPSGYVPQFPVRRTTKERERDIIERPTSSGRSNSSSGDEPILVLDHAPTPVNGRSASTATAATGGGASKGSMGGWKMPGTGGGSGMSGLPGRRNSVTAEKAMREVEKALAGVEAR